MLLNKAREVLQTKTVGEFHKLLDELIDMDILRFYVKPILSHYETEIRFDLLKNKDDNPLDTFYKLFKAFPYAEEKAIQVAHAESIIAMGLEYVKNEPIYDKSIERELYNRKFDNVDDLRFLNYLYTVPLILVGQLIRSSEIKFSWWELSNFQDFLKYASPIAPLENHDNG